jgi:hypothetical protein
MAKRASNIISNFPALSLTTVEGTWLPQKGWESREHLYFLDRNKSASFGLFSPPVPIRHGSKDPRPILQRWVLRAKPASGAPVHTGEILAWAEVQGFHRLFDVFSLFVSARKDTWRHKEARESLRMLISGIAIAGGSDVIKLVMTDASDPAEILTDTLPREDELFARERLWTPLRGSWARASSSPVGRVFPTLAISSHAWLETAAGQVHRATLGHLAHRYEPRRKPPQKAWHEPLLTRLFQLGRWRV